MNRQVFAIIAIAMLAGNVYADAAKKTAWENAVKAHTAAKTALTAASAAKSAAASAHADAVTLLATKKTALDKDTDEVAFQAKKTALGTARTAWKTAAEKSVTDYDAWVVLAKKVSGSEAKWKAFDDKVKTDATVTAKSTTFGKIATAKAAKPLVQSAVDTAEETYWTAVQAWGAKLLVAAAGGGAAATEAAALNKKKADGDDNTQACLDGWATFDTSSKADKTKGADYATAKTNYDNAKTTRDKKSAYTEWKAAFDDEATKKLAKDSKSDLHKSAFDDEASKSLAVKSALSACGTACAATTGTATATTTTCPKGTGTATATATATATTTGTRRLTTTTTATTATTAATGTAACPTTTAATTGASASHASIMLALTALILSRYFK